MTSEYRAQYDAGYDPELKYNPNGLENPTPVTRIIGGGVRGIAAGIGLVSEGVRELNDRRKLKSRKDVPSSPGSSPNTSDADLVKETLDEEGVDGATEQFDDGEDEDANDWHQDSESTKTGHEESLGQDLSPTQTGDAIEQFMSEIHSAEKTPDSLQPVVSPRSGKLPYPVILPQRRPGTKSRGFVRAYAPVLQSVDIAQETFLSFLKQLHKNSQASPVFDVVIIAANIGAFYPNSIAAATSTAVLIAAKAGQEVQERWRTNKFLNLANKELFMPKGLFAFVATYKPVPADITSSVTSGTYDMAAEAIIKYGDTFPPESEQDQRKTKGLKGKWQRLRLDSGQTFGEGQMPVTCAPLIFPGTDVSTLSTSSMFPLSPESASGVSVSSGEKISTPLRHKSSKKFVQDYFDRRAQATYAHYHPNSTLSRQVEQPKFRSRYADPNHPAASGHILSLITGGKVNPPSLGSRQRYEKAQRKMQQKWEKDQERIAKGKKPKGNYTKGRNRRLHENVVYLMIVNMPSEQELSEARAKILRAKADNEDAATA